MARTSTIWPGFANISGYFDKENVDFLSKKITETIKKDITTNVTIDTASIVRVMQRVLEQRLETVPKMNQRVIMYVVDDYLDYQIECNRNLWWAEAYVQSQRLFDPSVRRGAIANWTVKLNPKETATTARFYFT